MKFSYVCVLNAVMMAPGQQGLHTYSCCTEVCAMCLPGLAAVPAL